MRIAVLFDGGGLARLGLEQAGHSCTGFELDPAKHYLSRLVGSGNCILQDATKVDLEPFDAIWASPPCQHHSQQNHGNAGQKEFSDPHLLDWSISLKDQYPDKIVWVENVKSRVHDNGWGEFYNSAQFLQDPVQNRVRIIGGRYTPPEVYRPFQHRYPKLDICPAVLASEYKQGGKSRSWEKERRKATRWYFYKYGRVPTLQDMAQVQGFEIPDSWFSIPSDLRKPNGRKYTKRQWEINICEAIGNGVPVYMAKAFGEVYSGRELA